MWSDDLQLVADPTGSHVFDGKEDYIQTIGRDTDESDYILLLERLEKMMYENTGSVRFK